jgi:uncharacterized repeat protein (TIGR03843 family)
VTSERDPEVEELYEVYEELVAEDEDDDPSGAGEDPFAGLTRAKVLPEADALALLERGEVEVEGRLLSASNGTYYCGVELDGVRAAAVYKPVMGEAPLWDFPDGTLAQREVAAYEVSRRTGWDVVPPTVLRDGPAGTGMLQLWVDVDPAVDVVALVRTRAGTESAALRRVAVLDAVLNNADRKGGHLLPDPGGVIKGCDHGLTFHTEDKLRTVLWHWAGDPLPEESVDVLARLVSQLRTGDLAEVLGGLLTGREVRAFRHRVERLLQRGVLPQPPPGHRAIPWPPF